MEKVNRLNLYTCKIISSLRIFDDEDEAVFSLIIVYAYSKQHALEIICGIVPKPDIKNEFMFRWLPDKEPNKIQNKHEFMLNADGEPVEQRVYYKESAGWNTYEKSFIRGLRCIGYTDDLTKQGTIIYTDNDSLTKDDTEKNVEDDAELNSSSLPTEKDIIIAEQKLTIETQSQEIKKLKQEIEKLRQELVRLS
jgi:hypothetical protein